MLNGVDQMPLVKSSSKKAFSKNVSAEMHAGKPQKQAVAVAYSVKRKSQHGESKMKGHKSAHHMKAAHHMEKAAHHHEKAHHHMTKAKHEAKKMHGEPKKSSHGKMHHSKKMSGY